MIRCGHFGECGGCATQDIPYDEEVARKAAALSEVIGRRVEVEPSPVEYGYRTRMDFVYGWGKLGLRRKGKGHSVLDLEECHLIPPRAFDAARAGKALAEKYHLRSYDYLRHRGFLRYISVRVAPVSGERMLIFLTNGGDPAMPHLLDEADALADSVVWSISERRADVSFGDPVKFRKRDWIEERIGDLRFRFGPNSFFQSNPQQTEGIYRYVADRVAGETTDLCCGVGGLALFAARTVPRVLGVDVNAEGISFAKHNAAANGIDNVAFETHDIKRFLDGHRCDTMILDPPRAGLDFKNVRRIVACGPRKLIYVSCNPKVLKQELVFFRGYEITELRGFDLFPRTPHCEVVVVLEKA